MSWSRVCGAVVGLAFAGCTEGGGKEPPDGFTFVPANIDLSGVDTGAVGDVVVSGANQFVNTDDPAGTTIDADLFQFFVAEQAGGPDLAVYVVRSLEVTPSTVLFVVGASPLAIVALDTITVDGGLLAEPSQAGGGKQLLSYTDGIGSGGGPAGTETGALVAGSGGSYCGIGGRGGAGAGATGPNDQADPYGTDALVPLLPGSSGGTGALAFYGSGGGAIELVAGSAIEVPVGGWISVPGGGGAEGGLPVDQTAGGGGSGGAILLQAPSLTLAGDVAAAGGGGGQGWGGDAGEDGPFDGSAASGGDSPASSGLARGGDGGAEGAVDGSDGLDDPEQNPGGGGGGAGRIRLDSTDPADVSGHLSGCVTTGTL
jgi:hypothetical protein